MLWLWLACGDGELTVLVCDDCSTPGCEEALGCGEDCSDGQDNDLDGDVDCEDSECRGYAPCLEDCDDGLDNDGDGWVDCNDHECRGRQVPCIEVCDDRLDNDLDGKTDCDDRECIGVPECFEVCDDAQDNDRDGLTDCEDTADCRFDRACEEICDDGIDNDYNGYTDCEEDRCEEAPYCQEVCDDGVDNDMDGGADCADRECRNEAHCQEVCDDGIDNDFDGRTDCADHECSGKVTPCIEVCDDGLDNDLDGLLDCADEECSTRVEPCIEVCDDGLDNDLDGLVDCEDAHCQFACSETDCSDGLDNNANGRIDCEDEECWGLGDCEDALGLRVLSGQASWELSYYLGGVSTGTSAQRLRLDSPTGTATVGVDGSNLSCNWWAGSVFLSAFHNDQYEGYFGLGTSSAGISLRVNGLSSSGGCSPWLNSEALSFSTFHLRRPGDPSRTPFDHELEYGYPRPHRHILLDDHVIAAGYRTWFSSTHVYFASSFPIDPLLTEPWVFGP